RASGTRTTVTRCPVRRLRSLTTSSDPESRCRASRFAWSRGGTPAPESSGLRFPRRFRLSEIVEGDCLANKLLEGGRVHFFSFVDVDRAAHVSLETRVEETGRIFERRAFCEGELHGVLVGLTRADDAAVRPHRNARVRGLHPLPLLDDVRVR